MNAESAPGPAKTFRVRRYQINQQHGAEEMTAWKNRKPKPAPLGWPPNYPALEITLLRFVNPEVHLRERAGEDQRHPCCQTNNRQLQRRAYIGNLAQHLLKIGRTGQISRSSVFLFQPQRSGRLLSKTKPVRRAASRPPTFARSVRRCRR